MQTTSSSDKPYDPLEYYRRNPDLMRRYFPHLMQDGGQSGSTDSGMGQDPSMGVTDPMNPTATAATDTTSTNDVTINVRLRAMNLNKGGDSAANGNLAFAVASEFAKSPFFDAQGTKLSGDLEQVDASADTFSFSLTLKPKNGMRTM